MRITLNELKSIISEEVRDQQLLHVRYNIKAALAALDQNDTQTASSFLQRAMDKLVTMN